MGRARRLPGNEPDNRKIFGARGGQRLLNPPAAPAVTLALEDRLQPNRLGAPRPSVLDPT